MKRTDFEVVTVYAPFMSSRNKYEGFFSVLLYIFLFRLRQK